MADWDREGKGGGEVGEPRREVEKPGWPASTWAGGSSTAFGGYYGGGGDAGGYETRESPLWERATRGTHAGKGPRNYRRPDERIHEDVCDMLERDPDVDASDIEVKVEAGEVTLTGTVDERWTKRHAEDVIESIPGVRDVHNHLRIAPLPGAPRPGEGLTAEMPAPDRTSPSGRSMVTRNR